MLTRTYRTSLIKKGIRSCHSTNFLPYPPISEGLIIGFVSYIASFRKPAYSADLNYISIVPSRINTYLWVLTSWKSSDLLSGWILIFSYSLVWHLLVWLATCWKSLGLSSPHIPDHATPSYMGTGGVHPPGGVRKGPPSGRGKKLETPPETLKNWKIVIKSIEIDEKM